MPHGAFISIGMRLLCAAAAVLACHGEDPLRAVWGRPAEDPCGVDASCELTGEEDLLATVLLQADLRLRHLEPLTSSGTFSGPDLAKPAVTYEESDIWDPAPGQGMMESGPGGCALRVPNRILAAGPDTKFAWGECPRVLRGSRRPLRLALDVERDGSNATGYNPSLVALPLGLAERFPRGRWLAALRAGDEHYSMSMCRNKGVALSKAAEAALPSTEILWGTSAHVPFIVDEAIRRQDKTFRYGPRTYLVVLDADYRVLEQTTITMRNGGGPWDDSAMQDLRMLALGNGDLLVGFQAYYYGMSEIEKSGVDWRTHECVAKLHVQASASSGLEAWVDRKETRVVHDCPQEGLVAPGPKKNLGFLQAADKVYAVDWVYPTRVGELNMAAMDASRASKSDHITALCYGYEPAAPDLTSSPWQGMLSFQLLSETIGPVLPHNGTPLVWIEEMQAWLGIAHLLRFLRRHRDVWGIQSDYYTQQFYAIAGGPAMGRPFAVDRISSEFCFDSAQHPGRCETVQVATSLVRDGDTLQVGYGVMDCESYVVTVGIKEVLRMLKPVQ